MMEEKEIQFIKYWEANRLHEKKIRTQLLVGIPVGLLFALPIFIIVFSSRFWYKRADMVVNSSLSPWTLIIAVFIIVVFVAVFHKRHQWEMKEQQYQELKAKERQQI